MGPAELPQACPGSMAVRGPVLKWGRWVVRPHSKTNQDLNPLPMKSMGFPGQESQTPAALMWGIWFVTPGQLRRKKLRQKGKSGVTDYQEVPSA